jgi:hypothetical protein
MSMLAGLLDAGRLYKDSLTQAELHVLTAALKAKGLKLPKMGWCIRAFGGEICRHPKYTHRPEDTGYQVIGIRLDLSVHVRSPKDGPADEMAYYI